MDDDEPVGKLRSRRRAVELLGAPVLAWLAGCGSFTGPDDERESPTGTGDAPPSAEASPVGAGGTGGATGTPANACIVQPELTAGPFYEGDDENPRRSDIRRDTETGTVAEGVPLELTFVVSELTESACTRLSGAVVDVWQADAEGRYSDVLTAGTGGQDFLRGHQRTDADGLATFRTIYPGWYPGRTPHVHFRIRSSDDRDRTYEFTSQLFFREARSDAVYDREPYASRGPRDTRNAEDGIFGRGGRQLLLDLAERDDGLAATFDLAIEAP